MTIEPIYKTCKLCSTLLNVWHRNVMTWMHDQVKDVIVTWWVHKKGLRFNCVICLCIYFADQCIIILLFAIRQRLLNKFEHLSVSYHPHIVTETDRKKADKCRVFSQWRPSIYRSSVVRRSNSCPRLRLFPTPELSHGRLPDRCRRTD